MSAFDSINPDKATDDISLRIEESLESEVGNSIDFANVIFKSEKTIQRKPRVYYIPRKYKQKGSYDILKDISNLTSVNGFIGKCESCYQCCWILDI